MAITLTVPSKGDHQGALLAHAWFVYQLLPCPYRRPRWRPPVEAHVTYTTVQYGPHNPLRIGRII